MRRIGLILGLLLMGCGGILLMAGLILRLAANSVPVKGDVSGISFYAVQIRCGGARLGECLGHPVRPAKYTYLFAVEDVDLQDLRHTYTDGICINAHCRTMDEVLTWMGVAP